MSRRGPKSERIGQKKPKSRSALKAATSNSENKSEEMKSEQKLMDMEGVNLYIDLMWDVKRRMDFVQQVMSNEIHLKYVNPKVETIYLQFRLVLEEIALGSLVANPLVLQEVESKWGEFRSAKDLVRKVRNLNPNYYPKPIEIPAGNKFQWNKIEEHSYLTEDRFMTLYDICSSRALHINPLREKRDKQHYLDLENKAPKWHKWIINLLNAHTVSLVDQNELWFIQMGDGNTIPTADLFKKYYHATDIKGLSDLGLSS